MSDAIFPLEVLEKFAEAADGDYAAQAKICLLSRALFTFTQPRLYRSFNSILVPSSTGFELYLDKISRNKHLARLVESFCVVSMNHNLPRDVSTALLSMPNLKNLSLIGRQFTTPNNPYLDIWRDLFQSTNIPFKLESLHLRMRGDRNQSFESMSLAIFFRTQSTIHTLHCYHQTALITERDIPNLRQAFIDARNWDFIVAGGRPIEWLSLDADLQDAPQIKRVTPGSPAAKTLANVKRLRIDAEIMDHHNLSFYLQSLEFLICTSFSEVKHRAMINLLSKLKIICILNSSSNGQKRRGSADWLFANVRSLTDVVYSAPRGVAGRTDYVCERYRRGEKVPEKMNHTFAYQDLVGYE